MATCMQCLAFAHAETLPLSACLYGECVHVCLSRGSGEGGKPSNPKADRKSYTQDGLSVRGQRILG